MAELRSTTHALRAYPCFDVLPRGCFVHVNADDQSEPIVRAGELLVIDPAQRDPVLGELFLIEWQSSRHREVLMTLAHPRLTDCLNVAALRRRTAEIGPGCGANRRTFRWGDGPYQRDQLSQLLVGRVVGLFEPVFDEATLRVVS